MLIDAFLPKVEEWVDRSRGKVRADVVHDKLTLLGYPRSERTTRRAVAEVKAAWRAGCRRVHWAWVPEPGMWCQYDFGTGPTIASAIVHTADAADASLRRITIRWNRIEQHHPIQIQDS